MFLHFFVRGTVPQIGPPKRTTQITNIGKFIFPTIDFQKLLDTLLGTIIAPSQNTSEDDYSQGEMLHPIPTHASLAATAAPVCRFWFTSRTTEPKVLLV